jgi:hypothetical protein
VKTTFGAFVREKRKISTENKEKIIDKILEKHQ